MLGTLLRDARRKAGLTQEQVADRARVSSIYVSLVENGRRKVTVEVFLRLCDAIGVRGSELIKQLEESAG